MFNPQYANVTPEEVAALIESHASAISGNEEEARGLVISWLTGIQESVGSAVETAEDFQLILSCIAEEFDPNRTYRPV